MSSSGRNPVLLAINQYGQAEGSQPVPDRASGLAIECVNVSKSFVEVGDADLSGPDEAGVRDGRQLLLPFLARRRGRRRRVDAVRAVTLQVYPGEIIGILGQNGSGKSTLIRLMATLLLPDAGNIYIFGHDVVKEATLVRRYINRVSVEAAFFKKLSPWENLRYAARLYGLPPDRAACEVRAILDRLGLKRSKFHEPMEYLSRGQQQKVAIARALLTSPVVMLLDEPTTGLDPRSRREVQEFVQEINRERQATVVLTSHDMDEVDRLCDRVAIMEAGEVKALGTPAELKRTWCGREDASMEDVFFAVTGNLMEEETAENA
ncbi:MAG: ABC transporter ATP-binding protein [Limnochordales bacterium]|nr:ABC transporter ATP-binding protein [Limnochordales bacterium]